MARLKVTFTLDGLTVDRLSDAAERLGKPKSSIVREAIHDYHDRIGKLSEHERRRMLRLFEELLPRIPAKPASAVDSELEEIRRARSAMGRKGRSRTG